MSEFTAYEAAVQAVRVLALGLAPFNRRIRGGVRARLAAPAKLERWAAQHREPARPLFWLHAPSVGEALMAQAIIERLRADVPGSQVAFTWFSPSAERILDRVGADVTACLPWDVRRDVVRALDALRPAVIGFVRTEIWPVLMREAGARGVPVALVNAPLSEDSSRLRPLARRFLGPAYARLDAVGAVSGLDAERLHQLGARPERTRVTGDARVDQIFTRLDCGTCVDPVIARLHEAGVGVIVAGSTWPADEARLVPAFRLLRDGARTPLRLIVAPHQPTASHLAALEARVRASGLAAVRLSEVEKGSRLAEVVVVDRVGVLADLYRLAEAAWVGGGFGETGLHSVLEPAALGVPIVYGPRFGNAREARALVTAGGGFVATDADSAAARLGVLLADGGKAGRAAREWVESQRGGAARNADLLVRLLRGGAHVDVGG